MTAQMARKNLAINLRFYRKVFNLSQEKFGELIGSNLKYINELENCKRNLRIDMLDKISLGITNALSKNKHACDVLGCKVVTSSMLIDYFKEHETDYKRIDEK